MNATLCHRVLLALGLLAAAGCGASHAPGDPAGGNEKSAEEAVKVHAVAAEKRTLWESISGLGKCEALPDRMASEAPVIEGQVSRILVKLGDRVTRGQPLVELDSRIAKANLDEKAATRE